MTREEAFIEAFRRIQKEQRNFVWSIIRRAILPRPV